MANVSELKVLFVSPEVLPFAKTGGLADVSGSLPKALASLGVDIRIVTPNYKSNTKKGKYLTDFPVMIGYRKETCIIRESSILDDSEQQKEIPIHFVDNFHYFDRDGLYGYYDDGERFAFFCKAVINMLPIIDFKPDIIHINDWQTAPIAMSLNQTYKKYPFYSDMKTILTIHNLYYQGNFDPNITGYFDVGGEVLCYDKAEFYGTFSFIKAGLSYSDIITTVSECYAKEIQTPEFGEGMDGVLRSRSNNLYGIINGVSVNEFNPESDKSIFVNYNQDNFYYLKRENKFKLQQELGLPVRDVPVIAVITRFTPQKGIDLIIGGIEQILMKDVQLIVLGAGDFLYEEHLKDISRRYKDKFSLNLGYNETLARKIYAASDIFLMPSKYEPCGLGQIISLRYGTIPVVRATGGLADTIIDIGLLNENGNGFSFNEFKVEAFIDAIDRAMILYYENREWWNHIIYKGMTKDFSWNNSALKYLEIYKTAVNLY